MEWSGNWKIIQFEQIRFVVLMATGTRTRTNRERICQRFSFLLSSSSSSSSFSSVVSWRWCVLFVSKWNQEMPACQPAFVMIVDAFFGRNVFGLSFVWQSQFRESNITTAGPGQNRFSSFIISVDCYSLNEQPNHNYKYHISVEHQMVFFISSSVRHLVHHGRSLVKLLLLLLLLFQAT